MPGAADLDVVLALDPGAAWVADAYGAEARAPLPDGRTAVRIRVGRELLVPELVARLGGGGQLLEPARLRALTSDWLDAALANYAAAPR
jgi:proteasome accessory factor C